MKHIFAIFSFLFAFHSVFSQINAGQDTVICEIQSVDLSADYTPNSVVTNDYIVENIPYNSEAYTGTIVSMFDDSELGPFDIGFDFCFFGDVYNQFCLGSNGWITFACGQPTTFVSGPIPNINSPLNSIMGPWSDWNPWAGGEVRCETIGVAPNRSLVVSWIDVPLFGFDCTNFQGKFQIVLRESSNIIENNIEYKMNCPDEGAGGSHIAVQGIHNIDGTVALVVPGRNATEWVANNESYKYTPTSSTTTSNVQWFDESSNLVGEGTNISVNPSTTTTYTVIASECPNEYTDEVTVYVSEAVTINETIDDNLCPDEIYGNINILSSGGIQPLSYSWNCTNSSFTSNDKNITNIPSGTYQLIVTDSLGCETNIDNFTISATPESFVINEEIKEVSCFGYSNGSIKVTVSGGTPSYNYSWTGDNSFSASGNNIINNLQPGTYNLILTDNNGCKDSAEYFVNENTVIKIQSTTSNYNGYNISCNEGSNGWINFIASGGKAPYEYSLKKLETGEIISNESSIQNLGPGQYEFIVNDAEDCPTAHNFEFIDPEKLNINLLDFGNESCTYNNDGFIEVSIVGGPSTPVNSQNFMPYKHLWNKNGIAYSYQQNIYGLEHGLYTFNVTDANNCSTELNKEITEPPFVIAKYRVLNDTVTVNYPIINLYDDSDGNIIEWYWELSNGITSNEENIFNIDLSAELDSNGVKYYDLKLVVVDENQCTDSIYGTLAIKDEHTLYVPTGFTPDDDGINDVFKVFHHGLKNGTFNIRIYDRFGSNIFQSNDPNFEWNGTNMYTKNELITGSYTYVISYQDFEYKIYDHVNCENCSGTITLVR